MTYANPTAGDTANFTCPPPWFRTDADGQYVAGDAPDRSGHDRWLLAGSNWRGRGRFLGRDRDWFAPLWKTDPECRPHSRLCGSRSSCLDRTPLALASDRSDRLGGGPCPDRVLLCRAVHRRRELA